MNKKYRSEDKKVVFITNCIPSIPETPQNQCHVKNVRHANHQDTRQLIASPPNVKAYNYRLGGVDKHDRLVGQHAIPLISKRGYLRIFFHHLDTEPGKRVDLLQFNHQSEGWVEPGSQETLLTGLVQKNQSYYHYVAIIRLENTPTLPIQSLDLITQHQVQPIKKSPTTLWHWERNMSHLQNFTTYCLCGMQTGILLYVM